jgi:hypothetical protein
VTFLELQTDTTGRLRESSDSWIYFSDEDIKAAINAGYLELSDSAESHPKTCSSVLPRETKVTTVIGCIPAHPTETTTVAVYCGSKRVSTRDVR